MTPSYIHFLQQFNASGSQKAQGYDAQHFEGLAEDEQNAVFSMLKQELIAPGVIGWMLQLDPAKTVAALQDHISDKNNLAGRHRILIALFNQTKEQHYLDDLEDCFASLFEWEKADAIALYQAYAQPALRMVKFLEEVILNEDSIKILSKAATAWLLIKGVTDQQDFRTRRSLLESTDKATQLIGLNLKKSVL